MIDNFIYKTFKVLFYIFIIITIVLLFTLYIIDDLTNIKIYILVFYIILCSLFVLGLIYSSIYGFILSIKDNSIKSLLIDSIKNMIYSIIVLVICYLLLYHHIVFSSDYIIVIVFFLTPSIKKYYDYKTRGERKVNAK